MVFLFCHVFRLVVQLDSIIHPSNMNSLHNQFCLNQNRFSSPFAFWILTSFNNFLLVFNSSINFVVYCLVGRRFRAELKAVLTAMCRSIN